jgi:nucleotide-binding universal stress UspA family protein
MPGPIVVGYDGTDGARAALAEAVRIAGPLGAELVIAFAYHAGPVGGEVTDLAATLHERGEAVVNEALDTARSAGVTARGEIVHSKPADALAETAESEGAQMIVVGSYGEPPLKALVLGATAHKLTHITEIPVLIVRPRG